MPQQQSDQRGRRRPQCQQQRRVNGSQLFATNQNVANNAANIAKGLNIAADNGSDATSNWAKTVAYRSSDRNIVTNRVRQPD